MFIVSTAQTVIASSEAGVVGTFPSANCRTLQELDQTLLQITDALGKGEGAPIWGVNLIVNDMFARRDDDLELILKYQPPIVITSLGSPKKAIEKVHAYGGLVFSDVINFYHAQKCIDAGVDGLILVCNGAGGHTGELSPFAFVSEIKQRFDGIIIVGGSISRGESVLAVQAMGADLAYMGTRFNATVESNASDKFKQMILEASASDISKSNQVTGINANWLSKSLSEAGIDPVKGRSNGFVGRMQKLIYKLMKRTLKVDFDIAKSSAKRWRDIFSAGQGVGSIDNLPSTEILVEQLEREYTQAKSRLL